MSLSLNLSLALQRECNSSSFDNLATCNSTDGVQCRSTSNYTSDQTVTCEMYTEIIFCPKGKFCNDGVPRDCPVGHFCPLGSADPLVCPFPLASCAMKNQGEILYGVVFILLAVIFCALFWVYSQIGEYRIKKEAHREWEKVASRKKTNKYDAMNIHAAEHDQEVVMRTAEDLRNHLMVKQAAFHADQWESLRKELASSQASMYNMSASNYNMTVSGYIMTDATSSKNAMGMSGTNFIPPAPLSNPSAPHFAAPRAPLATNLGAGVRRVSVGRVAKECDKLMGKLQSTMAQFEYDEVPKALTISFTNMFLKLKSSGVTILSNVCASIKPRNVTAIMGPSGAGKTTLLALLRGHAPYATVSGSLTFNGRTFDNLEPFKHHIAYVPQDDIVSDELSVEENVVYAALLFNKRGFLQATEVMPMVLRAETLLDIGHIRTSVVGSAAKRGISGGQKKRVSICMELMKEAELLFLDEPTSGLDSASSMLVVNALHFLASKGVNVAATIHQPRQEILSLMDTLLLLAPGGRVAYCGPMVDLEGHFAKLQYTCPRATNIADFVMDTLCGFVAKDGETVQEVPKTIADICDWWEENRYPQSIAAAAAEGAAVRDATNFDVLLARHPSAEAANVAMAWRVRWSTQWLKVFFTCMHRQVMTNFRTVDTLWSLSCLLMVFGIIVAYLIGPMSMSDRGGIGTLAAQVTSGQLVFALLMQAASTRLFVADELLRDREMISGIMIGPYFLGKVLGNFSEPAFFAFAFLVGYYPFLQCREPFILMWVTFFLLHLAISGMVNFIVLVYSAPNKTTLAVGCVVLLWSFGGISPNYSTMVSSMSVFAQIINAISPFKYSFELTTLNELDMYPPTPWNVQKVLEVFDYKMSDRANCIGALVIYYVVANACAYLCIVAQRHYEKARKDAQEKYLRMYGQSLKFGWSGKSWRADDEDNEADEETFGAVDGAAQDGAAPQDVTAHGLEEVLTELERGGVEAQVELTNIFPYMPMAAKE